MEEIASSKHEQTEVGAGSLDHLVVSVAEIQDELYCSKHDDTTS